MLLFSTKIGNYRKNDILGGVQKLTFLRGSRKPQKVQKSVSKKGSKNWSKTGGPKNFKKPKSGNYRKIDILSKTKKVQKVEIIEKSTFLPKTQKVQKSEIIENRHFTKVQKSEKVEKR